MATSAAGAAAFFNTVAGHASGYRRKAACPTQPFELHILRMGHTDLGRPSA